MCIRDSNKVIARASPIIVSLERDLNDEMAKNVPTIVLKNAKAGWKEGKKAVEDAKAKLADANPPEWPESFSESFPKLSKTWQDAAILLASQLTAIRQADQDARARSD